jgi:hypothetical protein
MLDRAQLAAIPEAQVARPDAVARGVDASVMYLRSDAALRSLEVDPYWPKWDSPWWHMLVLFELGEAARIPARTAAALADRLDGLLHTFPITEAEKAGHDLKRDIACHCALGCMDQVLAACGLASLPWIPPWLERYQMRDGGLNCDEDAYLVTHECASSMVGTIAAFEAMLARDPGSAFCTRAAGFLIERQLTRGSASEHNAAEREAAAAWPRPTFPRFYFYDTLRGLAALVRWATLTRAPLPAAAVAVATDLAVRFPDGIVAVERNAFTAHGTILPTTDGTRSPRADALRFPLLDATCALGPSEPLTRQWTATRAALIALLDAGQIT